MPSRSSPRMLDLYSGAGGAAVGYSRAGWNVTGVDIAPQPRYPFAFVQGDALAYLAEHGHEYDAIHASPPCQAYSAMARMPNVGRHHPKLIEPVRRLLRATGRAYVIENVEGAPLRNAVLLCGTMFALPIRRHRLFETQPLLGLLTPSCSCRNGVAEGRLIGARLRGPKPRNKVIPPVFRDAELRAALGVEWMSLKESGQAIPPSYTAFIGAHLITALTDAVAQAAS